MFEIVEAYLVFNNASIFAILSVIELNVPEYPAYFLNKLFLWPIGVFSYIHENCKTAHFSDHLPKINDVSFKGS